MHKQIDLTKPNHEQLADLVLHSENSTDGQFEGFNELPYEAVNTLLKAIDFVITQGIVKQVKGTNLQSLVNDLVQLTTYDSDVLAGMHYDDNVEYAKGLDAVQTV